MFLLTVSRNSVAQDVLVESGIRYILSTGVTQPRGWGPYVVTESENEIPLSLKIYWLETYGRECMGAMTTSVSHIILTLEIGYFLTVDSAGSIEIIISFQTLLRSNCKVRVYKILYTQIPHTDSISYRRYSFHGTYWKLYVVITY